MFSFVVFLLLGTILAGAALAAILLYFDPFQASNLVFALFYLTAFLFSLGFFTMLISGLKRVFLAKKTPWQMVPSSLRHACFLSVLVNLALYLKHRHLLSWWTFGIMVAVLLFLELIFRIKLRHHDSFSNQTAS